MSYDNPSKDEIEQFRKLLLNQLLFEPTTDPGFARPVEKLHFLVNQSGEMIAQLRPIVDIYDQISATLSKQQEALDSQISYMDAVKSYAISVPSVREMVDDIDAIASLPAEERERRQKRRERETQLQREALNLFNQFVVLVPEQLRLQCLISQLLAVQVLGFLEQSGSAVVKGTKQLFPTQGDLPDLHEVFADGVDEIANEVGLGAVTPVVHIFMAIFNFIRRREINEKKSETAWADFDLNFFLLAYFAWWTEGDGSSTIKEIVEECRNRLGLHVQAAQTLTTKASQFIEALGQFRQNINSLQSSQQQTS